jgi:hypothetical protein
MSAFPLSLEKGPAWYVPSVNSSAPWIGGRIDRSWGLSLVVSAGIDYQFPFPRPGEFE